MLEFQVFRTKVFPSGQRLLFESAPSRSAILRQAVLAHPSGQLRGRAIWHIGNVEPLDDMGFYFRFGKTTRSTLEMFHDGVFEDAEFEMSPYTHVLLDNVLEVAAIAKKTRLARTTVGIANQLARLLNSSPEVRGQDARLEVSAIPDPEDFIEYLQHAHSISKFSLWFSRPNPFDANEDFIQPAQRYLAEANGEKGKVEIKGEDLNAVPLEEMARSAASTGDDASVRLRTSESGKPVTKYMGRRAVTVAEETLVEPEQKRELLKRLRDIYHRIRGTEG